MKVIDVSIKSIEDKEISLSSMDTPYVYISILRNSLSVENIEHFMELNAHADILYEHNIATYVIFNDSVSELKKKMKGFHCGFKISEHLHIIGSHDITLKSFFNLENNYNEGYDLNSIKQYLGTIEFEVLRTISESGIPSDLLFNQSQELIVSYTRKGHYNSFVVDKILHTVKVYEDDMKQKELIKSLLLQCC